MSWPGRGEPREVEIARIEAIPLAQPTAVYNLTVPGNECYFAEGVLAHNKPPPDITACLRFQADSNLNFHSGSPHPVTMQLYPLYWGAEENRFQETPVAELLEGPRWADAREVVVQPGESGIWKEKVRGTDSIGIIVNYHRPLGDPEAFEKIVVPARCGFRKPSISLSSGDVRLE